MSRPLFDRAAHSAALRSALADPAQAPPLPDGLVQWLGKLLLCEGVPFDHLVAEDSMLPPESIRFYTVDRNWQAALLDGAFSIGRLGPQDAALDRATLQPAAGPGLLELALQAARVASPALTGFLLRSEAVSGWWPGLRIEAYAAEATDDETLPVLRLQRLAPSLVLCLLDGVVARSSCTSRRRGCTSGSMARTRPRIRCCIGRCDTSRRPATPARAPRCPTATRTPGSPWRRMRPTRASCAPTAWSRWTAWRPARRPARSGSAAT